MLRELSCAKLQMNLAGGGTNKCNRVWMLLNIMIFTDLAFISLSILMSSDNCMLACPYMRELCWVTASGTALVWWGLQSSCLPSLVVFLNYITELKIIWPTCKHTSDILSECLNYVWMFELLSSGVWVCYWLYCTTINILLVYCQWKQYKTEIAY